MRILFGREDLDALFWIHGKSNVTDALIKLNTQIQRLFSLFLIPKKIEIASSLIFQTSEPLFVMHRQESFQRLINM